jgi:ribosomal protein S27E
MKKQKVKLQLLQIICKLLRNRHICFRYAGGKGIAKLQCLFCGRYIQSYYGLEPKLKIKSIRIIKNL